jgi:ferrous iron transport protein B
LAAPSTGNFRVDYGPEVETAIEAITPMISSNGLSSRAQAIMLLSGDSSASTHISMDPAKSKRVQEIIATCKSRLGAEPSLQINRKRLEAVDNLSRETISTASGGGGLFGSRFGRLAMHPLWGIPILVAVLYFIYEFVGVFGAGTLVNLMENGLFHGYINPFFTNLIGYLHWPFFQQMMVGEYGVITMAVTYSVAIVFPVVGTFFIVFGILEDSGYLPRLAFMVDRIFRLMGLNGKAVLPMILGLGCDTMATLTSRILETKKERVLVTFLLALGVPCSAQLGFILGMLSALSYKATLIWSGTIIIILFAVGFLYSKLIQGKRSDFILEVPPMRRPQLSNIFIKTFARIEWYLKEAVPLFILGTLFLFFLDYFKMLPKIEALCAPVITSLVGLPKEVTGPFLIGFLRRDYGAAGLFVLARDGKLDPIQVVVSLVTITLFIPCIANFFIIIKERGAKTAFAMAGFIFPFAFLVGGFLNWILHWMGATL